MLISGKRGKKKKKKKRATSSHNPPVSPRGLKQNQQTDECTWWSSMATKDPHTKHSVKLFTLESHHSEIDDEFGTRKSILQPIRPQPSQPGISPHGRMNQENRKNQLPASPFPLRSKFPDHGNCSYRMLSHLCNTYKNLETDSCSYFHNHMKEETTQCLKE